MELLSILLPRSERHEPVTALKKAFVTANAIEFIISQTVILDGIHIEIAFTLDTTYTC